MNDTIAGIATASGQGGIAIIRVSGAMAEPIMQKVFQSKTTEYQSHHLYYGHLLKDGQRVDECMAVLMRAPKSYTKEDVFELHTHGGDAAAMQALQVMLDNGARLAEAGEFTKRAFLNGRIDLSQAEAVMSMIQATGESALRSASQQLSGMQSRFIQQSKEHLINALAGIEAAIDYPDEIDEEEAVGELLPKLYAIEKILDETIDEKSARLIRDGLDVVLAGNPNAGKSTLFNALLNKDRAIVTDIPGTTRDLIYGSFYINGILVNLIDTAGMRITDDPVEAIGVERAKNIVSNADVVLYTVDGVNGLTQEDIAFIQSIDSPNNAVVITKTDLQHSLQMEAIRSFAKHIQIMFSSAVSSNGLQEVKEFLKQKSTLPKTLILTHTRHLHAAKTALQSVRNAIEQAKAQQALDFIAIDLKDALFALGEITGESVSEDLIDRIFESFCVGK
ncbi:MAG: tRNA uridine-5-carboxymethylaminomethyl(34) synthesis GTPase MnmE [Eubacteriales bacterium]|nr:tRNA uridine-5-carboxymethylaminomethyl(34) synthesis GTPase MnmE [Eubacteriales bacterium]